jgi:hypothetical protein
LWLSPDEKGEYLYGSGQDAVNKAWAKYRYIRTKNYGYIDIAHLQAGYNIGTEILKQLGANFPVVTARDEMSAAKGAYYFGIEIRYQVLRRPSDDLELKRMGLGMFMNFETVLEREQGGPEIFGIRTGELTTGTHFAIEDLPSDYLGFYWATRDFRRPVDSRLGPAEIQSELLNILGEDPNRPPYSDEGSPHCFGSSACAGLKNYAFTPKLPTERIYAGNVWPPKARNVPWPQALQMVPDLDSSRWRPISCQVSEYVGVLSFSRQCNAGQWNHLFPK